MQRAGVATELLTKLAQIHAGILGTNSVCGRPQRPLDPKRYPDALSTPFPVYHASVRYSDSSRRLWPAARRLCCLANLCSDSCRDLQPSDLHIASVPYSNYPSPSGSVLDNSWRISRQPWLVALKGALAKW